MLVVEKARHINLEITGQGMDLIASILRREIPSLVITGETGEAGDDESVLWDDSDLAKELAATWHPGITVSIKREHLGLTQAELSEKTGISIPNISLIENGKRLVGLRTAKKLAEALGITVERLLRLK